MAPNTQSAARPLTHMQNEGAFNHIMKKILGVADNSNVYLPLKYMGYQMQVSTFVEITNKECHLMKYKDNDTLVDAPALLITRQLRLWQGYLSYMSSNNTQVEPNEYKNVKYADFKTWLIEHRHRNLNSVPSPPSNARKTVVDNFVRGIKCDPSVYPYCCRNCTRL